MTRIRAALNDGAFELKGSVLRSLNDDSLIGLRLKIQGQESELNDLSHIQILDFCDLAGGRHEILKWLLSEISKFSVATKNLSLENFKFYLEMPATFLFHKNLVGMLTSICKEVGLENGSLVLEVGEELAWSRPERANHLLDELTQNGIRFSLENFGAGHSSLTQLAHLKRFALDSIGISADLIRESVRGAERREFVGAIIKAAHHLGQKVSAKKISDPAVFEILKSLGCDFAEGTPAVEERALHEWITVFGKTPGKSSFVDLPI
jgi:EAL domain-containing protein (putative c-di-GMP-specific phosphodiesterase class I)